MALEFFIEPHPEEAKVRAATAALVATAVRPYAIQDDQRNFFRRAAFDAVARLGYHCLSQPAEFGGGGLPHRCYYSFLEELARASLSVTVSVSVTNLVQGAISTFGNAEQKDFYLRQLTSGKWLGAFSLSEPGAGSDAASLRLSVRRTTGGYVLNGNKCWCSNAGDADLYLVMGRTGEHKTHGISSFLVPKDTKGFRVGKQEKKLGLRGSTLAELVFEECFIPESQRLGAEGQGLAVALSQLDAGRIAIGTIGIGAAIESIDRAWRFLDAGTAEFPEGMRQTLAEHYAHTLAARGLVVQAAARKDRGETITVIAAATKLLGSDLAVRVANDAVQFMGTAGVTRAYEVERILRDAKALQIVEGTNQIQRRVLAREVGEMMTDPAQA